MDVTCERCQTAYEFDETLVSDRGTTVKCSNCAHLFKVYRSQDETPTVVSQPWILRRVGGQTASFAELSTLQQWILDGKVDRDDEISRTGEVWKRLGAIAELTTFFNAADAAQPAMMRERQQRLTPRGGFNAVPTDRDAMAVLPTVRVSPQDALAATPMRAGKERQDPTAPHIIGSLPTVFDPRTGVESGVAGRIRATASFPATSRPFTAPMAPPPGSIPEPSISPLPQPAPPLQVTLAPPLQATLASTPLPSIPEPAPVPASASGRIPLPSAPIPAPVVVTDPTPRVRHVFSTDPGFSAVPAARDESLTMGSIPPPQMDHGPSGGISGLRPSMAGPAWESEPPSAVTTTPAANAQTAVTTSESPIAVPPRGAGKLLALAGAAVVVVGYLAYRGLAGGDGDGSADDRGAPFLARGLARIAEDTDAAFADATTEITKALAFREDDPRALAGLATLEALQALYAADEARDAEASFTRASPTDAAALRARAESRRSASAEQLRKAAAHADQAARAADAGEDVRRAVALVRAIEGRHAEARTALGQAGGGAETDFVRGVLAEEERGRTADEAEAAYAEAVRAAPDLHRARVRLARVFAGRGNAERARAALAPVLRAVPTHARASMLRAAIDGSQPPFAGLVAVQGEAAPAGAPGDAGVAAAPDAGTAVAVASTAPAAGEEATPPRGGGGGALAGGPSYDDAIAEAENLRARARCDRAVPLYERALSLRAGSSEALAGLGHCLLARGDAGAALARFEAAVRVNPSYALAHFGLGESYRRLGRRSQAVSAYGEYLALVPSGGMAERARSAIAQLQGSSAEPAPEHQGGAPGEPTPGGDADPPPEPPPPQSDSLDEESEPPVRPGEPI